MTPSVSVIGLTVLRMLDLLTSRAFEREARSYERGAQASEREARDQKTKRTTLRKSMRMLNSQHKPDLNQ